MAISDISPVQFEINTQRVELWVEDAWISKPCAPLGSIGVNNPTIYPTECRQRGCTYKGKLEAKFGWSLDGISMPIIDKDFGDVPIMLKVVL